MALFMIMGKFSREAIKAIMETGSDREAAARQAIEAAGGKLLGYYGMFGQDYNVVAICDMPGTAEYIGAVMPAISGGTLESWKSIPLFTAADITKAAGIAREVASVYRPPGQ